MSAPDKSREQLLAEIARLRTQLEQARSVPNEEPQLRELLGRFGPTHGNEIDGIVLIDASGIISHANAEAERCFGQPRQALVGSLFSKLLPQRHRDDRPPGVRGFQERVEPFASQRFEIMGVRANKHEFPIELTITPFAQSGHSLYSTVIRDMSERRRMERQLAVADRLAALGTLAAGVAHEVNNPLTYVLLDIDSVRRTLNRTGPNAPLGERFTKALQRLDSAREGAKRVSEIVRDLKAFARVDEEKLGPVDIQMVLDDVLVMLGNEIRYRGQVMTHYTATRDMQGNEARLRQVFMNLLINAAHSLPEAEREKNVIHVSTSSDDNNVIVEIQDSGSGIPEDQLSHIFDPFFTTKPIGEGSGLGLWICHSIVKQHHGEIELQSTVGLGTTFRVSIPCDRSGTAMPRVEQPNSASFEVPRARLLVVDDEVQIATALRDLLDAHDVVVAVTGLQALDHIDRNPSFDLILCDLMMADATGMEIYQRVRSSHPGLEQHIVFMTGGAYTPNTRAFLRDVNNPCLRKPFDIDSIQALLRRLIVPRRA